MLRNTAQKSLTTGWEILKVMLPVYVGVSLLQLTPAMPWLGEQLAPLLDWLRLPGEAGVPLVVGYVIGVYAAIGALAPLGLNAREVTTLGLMLAVAHALPTEGVILVKMGARGWRITLLRLVVSLAVGWAVSRLWV